MSFFIIIGTLCILLAVNVETKLSKCFLFRKDGELQDFTFPYGYVCTKSTCDWTEDSTCKSGTYSKVLEWETDIFEVGLPKQRDRPKEVIIKIDLNKDYYIEIKIISDNKKRTVKTILNECSHAKIKCSENKSFQLSNLILERDQMFVAIGFRKDKKINFVAVSETYNRASNYFGPKNEYELTPDFHFNTNETMKITISSNFDKDLEYDGFRMVFPTSIGGFVFNVDGDLIHGNDYGCKFYFNKKEGEGLPYILKEYYKNSENWKATPVKFTKEWGLPYFDENGMKIKTEELKIKEEKNPHFDEKKMVRKHCQYVDPDSGKEIKKPKPEKATVPVDLLPLDGAQYLPAEIIIADEVFIKKANYTEKNIDINEFIDRVGGKESLHHDYLSNLRKGGDDYNAKLLNGTHVNLKYYLFKNPSTKKGGSGGAGDANRGQKQVKIIATKYIVILILMILSV